MLPIKPKRIILIWDKFDFRKHMNGLLGEAYKRFLNPYEGDCLVFIHKRGNQIRCILGDEYGLYEISRRFEGGSLSIKSIFNSNKSTITQSELGMLLEGKNFMVTKQLKRWVPTHLTPGSSQ